jgi:hypothetical protein
VQDHAADELHVEVALAESPPGCFADRGEGLGQQFVQGGAGRDAFTEFGGLGDSASMAGSRALICGTRRW